jgi:hypothetical protein
VADAIPSPHPPRRRAGQASGPRPHQYEEVRGSESDIDEMSDFSEIDSPPVDEPPSRNKKVGIKRVGISMNPHGGRRKPAEVIDPDDDTIPKL